MDVLIKCAGLAVVSAIAALSIRKSAPEIAVVLLICAGSVIIWSAIGAVNNITSFLDDMVGYTKVIKPVFSPLVKTVGVSVISKISADMCRDAGSAALASCVEFAGCAVAVVLSLPLLMSVMELVASI